VVTLNGVISPKLIKGRVNRTANDGR